METKYKIGILVSFTTKKCNIKSYHDLVFNRYTFPFLTENKSNNQFVVYLGYDDDDPYLTSTTASQEGLDKFISHKFKNFPHITHKLFKIHNISTNNPCFVWNKLFQEAYNDGCDYFYQMGDDISINYHNWDDVYIRELQKHGDIGLTGCYTTQTHMLTQLFVSRKHMEIFGYFFPPIFKNWWCDDWVNGVYKPNHIYPITTFIGNNNLVLGNKRYDVDYNVQDKIDNLISASRQHLIDFLSKSACTV